MALRCSLPLVGSRLGSQAEPLLAPPTDDLRLRVDFHLLVLLIPVVQPGFQPVLHLDRRLLVLGSRLEPLLDLQLVGHLVHRLVTLLSRQI